MGEYSVILYGNFVYKSGSFMDVTTYALYEAANSGYVNLVHDLRKLFSYKW